MSNNPSQPCGPYLPDQRYWTPARPLPYSGPQEAPANSSYIHPTPQGPPRFLYPDNQGYDAAVAARSHGSWLPSQGRPQTGNTDPRYFGSLPHPSVPRASPVNVQHHAPGSAEQSGFPGYYQESSSFVYGRGSVGSGGWSNDVDSQHSSSSVAFPSPVHSDETYAGSSSAAATANYQQLKSQQPEEQSLSQQQQGKQKDPSDCTTAMGLDKILHHSPVSQPRKLASSPPRYHLHIRQQPIAARACGAGDRDRRPVDPSPIVQMLVTDFDPTWPPDLDILQDPRFTVGCLLYPAVGATGPATATANKESRTINPEDNLPGQSTPLLSGKAFVSPFFVNADPDPDTAPAHPAGKSNNPKAVLGLPNLQSGERRDSSGASREIPATFFIFSDLSVRTAGLYQFQFRLMNWGNVEDTGQSMPILAEAWSEPFRVYPAKDFPGMRDSSPLAEGLKELGFVELKTRGKGKGKGRKR